MADKNQQNAGGERVKGAAMANLFNASYSADLPHNIVGSGAGWFIDDNYSVHSLTIS